MLDPIQAEVESAHTRPYSPLHGTQEKAKALETVARKRVDSSVLAQPKALRHSHITVAQAKSEKLKDIYGEEQKVEPPPTSHPTYLGRH